MRSAPGSGALLVLVRSFLRRDRWMIFWFAVATALLFWSQAPSAENLYTTQAAFDRAAQSMAHNAAFVAMAGPPRALNTVGGQVAWQASAFGAILLGLLSMFLVARHTRAEEESGRDELLRSTAISRSAPMSATLVVATVANVIAGALVTASLLSYGLAAAGSVALGAGVTATGLCFTGTALLAAQLTGSTRAMYGIAGAVIGVAYGLRAVGDVGNGVLSWLSPIGWFQAMHAFSGERWWPLLLILAGAVASATTAYAVFRRRDVGSGVLPDRPGPARGELSTSLGLSWRLQRGSVIGWCTGLFLGGLAYGSIGDDVGSLVGDSQFSQDLFTGGPGSLVDGFYATSALMLVLIGSGFTIASALRGRGEEEAGHLEPLLATALPRSRWMAAQVVVTVAGTLAVMLAAGVGLGLGYAAVTGDGGAIGRLVGAVLALLPGALLLGGLARLLVGLLPRWAGAAWLALGFCVVVLLFAAALRFPGWLQDLSPFEHLGRVPATGVGWTGFAVSLAVAALFSGLGQVGFTRRDLRSS